MNKRRRHTSDPDVYDEAERIVDDYMAPEEDLDLDETLAQVDRAMRAPARAEASEIVDDYMGDADLSPIDHSTDSLHGVDMVVTPAEAEQGIIAAEYEAEQPDMVISPEEAEQGIAEAEAESVTDPEAIYALDPSHDEDDIIDPEPDDSAWEDRYADDDTPAPLRPGSDPIVPASTDDPVDPAGLGFELEEPEMGSQLDPWYESSSEPPGAAWASLGTSEDADAGDVAPDLAEGEEDPAEGQDDAIATAPRDPASALGNPAQPPEDDGSPMDKGIAMWDQRIQRLQQMERSTQSGALRRILRNLIASAVGGASRALSMYGNPGRIDTARRPYEHGLRERSGEERRLDQLIADQGAQWTAQDQLRDRTAIEAERLRQTGARQDQQYQQMQLTAADRAERRDIDRARVAEQAATGAARREELGARAQRTRARMEREQAEVEPGSGRSSRAQAAFMAAADTLPEDVREALAPHLERIDEMSATELNELADNIHHYAQGRLARRDDTRRRGGGGGSAGPASEALAAATEARVAQLRQHNIVTEEQGRILVEGMRDRNPRRRAEVAAQLDDLASRLPTRPTATQGAREEDESEGIPILMNPEGEAVRIRVGGGGVGEVRDIRRSFNQYSSAMQHLRAIRTLMEQHGGARALVDPRVRRRLQHHLVPLRGMVTEVQHTGVIQVSEMPAINSELPNPTQVDQQFLDTWAASLDEWSRIVRVEALTSLRNMGTTPEELALADRMLHGRGGRRSAPRREGAASPAQADRAATPSIPEGAQRDSQGNYIMTNPDGQRARVPPERVEFRLDNGWSF